MSMFFVGASGYCFEGMIEIPRRAPKAKQQAPANPLILTGTTRKVTNLSRPTRRMEAEATLKSTMSVNSVWMARREVDEVVTSSVFTTFLNGLRAVIGTVMGCTINTLDPITFLDCLRLRSKSDRAGLLHRFNVDKVKTTRSTELNALRVVEAKATRQHPREQEFGEIIPATNRSLII